MPKSEHPKSGKRRNRNFCVFGFWHVQILNVRALKMSINVSKNPTFGNRQFGLKPNNFRPNGPKPNVLCLKSELCSKFEHSVPLELSNVPISDIQKCPKKELF